jgi:hypothetical protein
MDDNGDGTITEFEFLKYMLVKADLSDPGILDSLHSRCERVGVLACCCSSFFLFGLKHWLF